MDWQIWVQIQFYPLSAVWAWTVYLTSLDLFLIYKINIMRTYPLLGTVVKIKWNNVGKALDMIPSTKETCNKRRDNRGEMVVK